MYVKERFELNDSFKDHLQSLVPKFGYDGFGELTYYTRFSRRKNDGGQEHWADSVTRVTEGTFSIRKDWYLKNHIKWHEGYWQDYAQGFATYLFNMYWLPPGRGLWAMGTDFVYERGAMSLYNCAYTRLRGSAKLPSDLSWMMDGLMNGVGVGFNPTDDPVAIIRPSSTYLFVIPDSREGWCEALYRLVKAYTQGGPKPIFDYSLIRPAGMPIKGFGGIASGPEPLQELLEQTDKQLFDHRAGRETYLKSNLANMIGCCVVAGNVRRSAEIACKSIQDKEFLDLKDYEKYPERAEWGWMSNNSAILKNPEDFEQLGEIARRVLRNGEPGIINACNLPFGRIGKFDDVREDMAEGFNPCGSDFAA
jgi:ribonucleoside-triphosphate reductase